MKKLSKLKLILNNKITYNKYVNKYKKNYTILLTSKSIFQLQSLNFDLFEDKIIMKLQWKSETTKKLTLLKLYALEKVIKEIIMNKLSSNL